QWRAFNEMGKASLFTNLSGHDGWRACSQIVADRRKWAIGLGIEEGALLSEISTRFKGSIASQAIEATGAPVKEVIIQGDDVDLFDVPTPFTSEDDGGRFFAAGIAVIKDPDTGIRNLSVHRQQVLGKNKTGFLMLPRQTRRIYEMYCARGEAMPVAVFFGSHPAIFLAASFTTAFGNDEMGLAGSLLGEPVRMVPCESVDLEVPAEAELVLEGEVPPDIIEPEGPYGEVTGTYAGAGEAEIFQVETITRRADPIFYALHCGAPVTDAQSTMGLGIEVATKNHLAQVEGGIELLDLRTVTASGDMMLILKLRPRQPGQAKTALMAALSGPYLHPKLAIAVDEDIDAGDLRQIAWSMTTRVEASRDVTMIPDTRVFGLDSISPRVSGMGPFSRLGTKWLIDATLPVELDDAGRREFAAAYPKNFDQVRLEDFLS
ncbi:MAG: UbiD family decarboxylase, partial [Rhodospirillales bacterium]|nr:UbiD family decarboxylase [Rhodospirillales bacterium]